MASEAAGQAYITTNLPLKARLEARAQEWVRLGEEADKQDVRNQRPI
jgi:hypothetical protein